MVFEVDVQAANDWRYPSGFDSRHVPFEGKGWMALVVRDGLNAATLSACECLVTTRRAVVVTISCRSLGTTAENSMPAGLSP